MKRIAVVLALAGILTPGSSGAIAGCADLALVLAVDSSSSIDETEFNMQLHAYASAFGDPAVMRALRDAGRVDVATVIWADSSKPERVIDWQRIESDADAMTVAESFLGLGRDRAGDTDLGNGLWTALDLLDDPDRCHARAVINVSGDGRDSLNSRLHPVASLVEARTRAQSMGVMVNGLAILNAEPSLGEYFRGSLITGPGAFVVEAADFHDFRESLVHKLEREIRPQLSASLETAPARP